MSLRNYVRSFRSKIPVLSCAIFFLFSSLVFATEDIWTTDVNTSLPSSGLFPMADIYCQGKCLKPTPGGGCADWEQVGYSCPSCGCREECLDNPCEHKKQVCTRCDCDCQYSQVCRCVDL
jgi:hypothetical protein